ncbi:MAG: XisI protein [Caldilinea sp. CFX5]|nr:XisI protein [Caldilinea sp. CFX5]
MDTLTQQRTLIKKTLSDYAQVANQAPDGVETHLVFDEERDHYMAFRTGWWRKKRIHSAVIYVRLQNSKIWIEEDWTEDGIATELLEAGVAKEEIILAFHHPTMRGYSEFAVA